MGPQKPNYAPNVVNQTVQFGGATWKGNPGSDWTLQSTDAQDNVQKQADQSQQNFNNLITSNTKAVTDFLGNYKTDTQNALTQSNVPQFQNLVTGLNSRISDLETNSSNSGGGSVGATGAGGFSSAGQVDTAVSSRYLPQLNAAEQNLGTSLSEANTLLQPDQAYEDLLKTNITTSMSGLSSEQQTVMQGIIAKLDAGVSLTQTEMQTGEDYAKTVLDNANNITLQKLKNQYTGIPSGNVTINPSSGQIINPYLLATQNGGVYTP